MRWARHVAGRYGREEKYIQSFGCKLDENLSVDEQ
jgi:hypothetical protein